MTLALASLAFLSLGVAAGLLVRRLRASNAPEAAAAESPSPETTTAAAIDPFAELSLEALVLGSKVSTVEPTVGERVATADIAIRLTTPSTLLLERIWVAIPGTPPPRTHLEVGGIPYDVDSDGRCTGAPPQLRGGEGWQVVVSQTWNPRGTSVAEMDEAVPILVTLDLADETATKRKSVRVLCHLASSTESRLYLDEEQRQLVHRVFERNVASMHLLKS